MTTLHLDAHVSTHTGRTAAHAWARALVLASGTVLVLLALDGGAAWVLGKGGALSGWLTARASDGAVLTAILALTCIGVTVALGQLREDADKPTYDVR